MTVGENPMDDDRRAPGDDVQQHVAQVWAAPIADLDELGLFRLGTACLDVAEATPDPERCALLSEVAFALLTYTGAKNAVLREHIVRLCDREQQGAEPRPEIARVIAELEEQFRTDDDFRDAIPASD
jgi:hypothetical protein